ncbi:hypothetical protein GQ44DRAFT_96024 [Phaeosphaeriaceae sp. PMI808]|nr:hypothetical protein GQ44DRAFT_96024 [Phaeosphaeriaceae sp. PMI808]
MALTPSHREEFVKSKTQSVLYVESDNGYQLVDIPTVVKAEHFLEANKTDEGKVFIKDVYFKECKRIIEEVTGGTGMIIPVSFRIREQKGAKENTNEKLGSIESRYAPRPVAHLDRDTPTAITVLEEAVGKEKAQELLSKHKRWAQVNVWNTLPQLMSTN